MVGCLFSEKLRRRSCEILRPNSGYLFSSLFLNLKLSRPSYSNPFRNSNAVTDPSETRSKKDVTARCRCHLLSTLSISSASIRYSGQNQMLVSNRHTIVSTAAQTKHPGLRFQTEPPDGSVLVHISAISFQSMPRAWAGVPRRLPARAPPSGARHRRAALPLPAGRAPAPEPRGHRSRHFQVRRFALVAVREHGGVGECPAVAWHGGAPVALYVRASR